MGREENVRDWFPEDDEDFSESVEDQEDAMRQWHGKS